MKSKSIIKHGAILSPTLFKFLVFNMLSLYSAKKFFLIIAVMFGFHTTHAMYNVNGSLRDGLLIVGGCMLGVSASIIGYLVWNELFYPSLEKKLGLPRNAFIGYYIGFPVKDGERDTEDERIAKEPLFKQSTLIFDATNRIAYAPSDTEVYGSIKKHYSLYELNDTVYRIGSLDKSANGWIDFDKNKNRAALKSLNSTQPLRTSINQDI